MSSPDCVHACRPPYASFDRNRPCPACLEQHGRDMDVSYAEYTLQKQHLQLLKAVPATDAEWLTHCDELAPLELVASMSLDFRSKPGIDSLPSGWEVP